MGILNWNSELWTRFEDLRTFLEIFVMNWRWHWIGIPMILLVIAIWPLGQALDLGFRLIINDKAGWHLRVNQRHPAWIPETGADTGSSGDYGTHWLHLYSGRGLGVTHLNNNSTPSTIRPSKQSPHLTLESIFSLSKVTTWTCTVWDEPHDMTVFMLWCKVSRGSWQGFHCHAKVFQLFVTHRVSCPHKLSFTARVMTGLHALRCNNIISVERKM